MSHPCPGPSCDKTVDNSMLMCSRHWYQVPRTIRAAVWSAWQNGNGMGSAAHVAAMRAAIRSLQDKAARDA